MYFLKTKKPTDPKILEKRKRIRTHNKMIIEKRNKGVLKPLGTVTYNSILKGLYDRKAKPQFVTLSENGSVLPNKFALWSDGEYCELDY